MLRESRALPIGINCKYKQRDSRQERSMSEGLSCDHPPGQSMFVTAEGLEYPDRLCSPDNFQTTAAPTISIEFSNRTV